MGVDGSWESVSCVRRRRRKGSVKDLVDVEMLMESQVGVKTWIYSEMSLERQHTEKQTHVLCWRINFLKDMFKKNSIMSCLIMKQYTRDDDTQVWEKEHSRSIKIDRKQWKGWN